jgi:hypothetical protein
MLFLRNEPTDLVQTKDLVFSNAKNELVFDANEPQSNPKKGPKKRLLWGIEVKICESKGGSGRASTRGATRAWNLTSPGIRIRRAQSRALGQATGVAKCKEALDALH